MKKVGTIVALMLVLLSGVVMSASAAEIKVEGDAYVGVFDKYLWRGFDLSGGQPVLQGGVDLTSGAFTLSYWSNYQLSADEGEGLSSNEMNETDIILDYSFSPVDLVSVNVGNIFYAVEGIEDTNEFYVTVAVDTLLTPNLTINYDWDEAHEDGLYFVAAVGHDFELSDALSLHLGAAASYNQNSDYLVGDFSGWHNAEFNVGAEYALTDQVWLNPSFMYSTPLSNDAEDIAGIDDEVMASLTVGVSF